MPRTSKVGWFFAAWMSASAAAAQPTKANPAPEPAPPAAAAPARPFLGGLGYASVAPFFGNLSGLDSALQAPDALGQSYGLGKSAVLLGGGGGAILFGHLWVGGKGYGLVTGASSNARGTATLSGGGGGFEFGYVVIPVEKLLLIPFFGFGGFGSELEVENKTNRAIRIQPGVTIPAGGTQVFSSGFPTLEIGLRVQRLLFFGSGGFTAGFEVGALSSFSSDPWKAGNVELTDQRGAVLQGGYARINLGGGGFWFRRR
jgi:hypothetical protein